MTKSELESKPLSDLHALAAEAGVERFRMLTKGELIDRLADGGGSGGGSSAGRSGSGRASSGRGGDRAGNGGRSSSSARRRRRGGSGSGSDGERERERPAPAETEEEAAEPADSPAATTASTTSSAGSEREGGEESGRPRRRRRRRRPFGRRGKEGVTLQDLLLPPEAGRQTVLVGESRAACTELLRAVAADLAGDSNGPDPVALLIDPSPEELAEWKRDAPQAEIVSAGQARHATDALAQARSRAGSEDVILLVDSLTRLAADFGDTDTAKEFFDAGKGVSGGGSLTVVAALERSDQN